MVKYGAWFEKRMEFLEIKSTSKYVSWHYILMSPSAGCGEIMQCGNCSYLLIFPQNAVMLDHLGSSNRRENRNRF